MKKGKPFEKMGRKAMGLPLEQPRSPGYQISHL